ncbi:MAG: hypothetical protein PVJ57_22135 [Phycisphaerae bacterium]|jgi:hypothetical protein
MKSEISQIEGAPTRIIEAKIDRVMRGLAESLSGVLRGLPGNPRRPQALAEFLDLNKSLSSRLCRAVRVPDPFAAAHLMPGPEALRMLLRAAAGKGVGRSTIVAAEKAVSAFEQLIEHDVGSRDGLEAVISESLPDARRKFELANKQAMFKAAANLKGMMAEVYWVTFLAHPGKDAERHDVAGLSGLRGLRRVRPGAAVLVTNRVMATDLGDEAYLTLDGGRIDGIDGLLLKPYCSSPLPELDAKQKGSCLYYRLADPGYGPNSAVDLTFAELCRRSIHRYRPAQGKRISGTWAEVEHPVKTLVFDFLLHQDVWPGCEPELRIYDTIVRGTAEPENPERDIDLLELDESIELLGRTAAKFRAVEIPNYLDMLRHACGRLGWDVEQFRGYRCRIQYPFYGSQVCMAFNLPESPPS